MQAPRARFLTKVYHPNVCPNGAIHADIFGGFWSPAITLEVCMYTPRYTLARLTGASIAFGVGPALGAKS